MIKQVKKYISEQAFVPLYECSSVKCYAVCIDNIIYSLQQVLDCNYAFINIINTSDYLQDEYYSDFEDCLKQTINAGLNVYQFDTQEEFFRWALEQITGKKFKNTYVPSCYLGIVASLNDLIPKTVEVLV